MAQLTPVPKTLLLVVVLSLGAVACSGARHRKVVGPPPEYELPDDQLPDAGASREAGR